MAFIFSTSHLPETRVPRPDHLDDEEEEDVDVMPMPMPRAGGVRAFSHLPQPVRSQAEFSDPLSTHPATPVGRPRPHTEPDDDQDTGHAPAPESDHDDEDDTAPQDHADDRPWYMPRITAHDLSPEDHPEDAHSPAPKPWENTTRSSRFDVAPPADHSTSSSGPPPSPQDLRDAFHSPAPDTLSGEAPAQDSRPALTRGRIFEKSLPPGMRNQLSALSSNLSHVPNAPFQTMAATVDAGQQGRSYQQAAPKTMPAAQPPAPAQAPRAATESSQNAPGAPQQQAGSGTEKKSDSPAADPRIRIDVTDPKFEAAARAALAEEAASSPMAAALLREATRLGLSIVPQKGFRMSETLPGQDGSPVIHFNPYRKTDTTMSHEIAHVIQKMAFKQVIDEVKKTGKLPDADDIKRATQAGRDALNKIIPVQSDKDQGQEHLENEAMRTAHIVGAERTASEMKDLPEDQKTLEEFLRRQAEKEKARGEPEKGRKHPNNEQPLPPGTERGSYDYQYVRDILGLDEKGQKKARPSPAPQPSPKIPLPKPPPVT